MPDVTATELTDVEEAKLFLDLRQSDNDEMIKRIIIGVSEHCEAYCGRSFKSATYTDEIYDGTGTDVLVLKDHPVTAVAKVIAWRDGPELVQGTDYEFDADGLIVLIGLVTTGTLSQAGKFPRGRRGVTISYTAGYATLPGDLLLSLHKAIAFEFRKFDKGSIGVLSQGLGTESSIEFIKAMYPPEVIDVWNRYRRIR